MPPPLSESRPPVELLSPARDLECGRAAIDCGADAVYVGAARFGAREKAGNSLEDIAALAEYGHRFRVRVYAALNTLLRDAELPDARALAWDLHAAGVDGLIVQDPGLLECGLPPLPLIASTQMHNNTPEKVAFLEQAGFLRAILARELDLDQIREIRQAAPRIELECFVHGALCVCYSGQCYLSLALGGRSGNRGQCAQPCRKPYSLLDGQGRVLERGRHLLSLRDLDLSEHLGALLDAGVGSFKIEGRLKDRLYVSNLTAHYRARLDTALAARGLRRAASGTSAPGFVPDPRKTFNRGGTIYFLKGRGAPVGAPETPKMTGEALGPVTAVLPGGFEIRTDETLHAGDGVCFFDSRGTLRGSVVNAVRGRMVTLENPEGLERGTLLHRNHDHAFLTALKQSRPERRIGVRFVLRETDSGFALAAEDEDGNRAEARLECAREAAARSAEAEENTRRQLSKTGESVFACTGTELDWAVPRFLRAAQLNGLRRQALEALSEERERNRPHATAVWRHTDHPWPGTVLGFEGNVLNRQAAAFYRRHGVQSIAPAAETGADLRGRRVMTMRYCLKHELGICPRLDGKRGRPGPLSLTDAEGNRLDLRFECERCEMEVVLGSAASVRPARRSGRG